MSVTGYLALYTTLLGWQQYQNLWGIVTGTGLIYLPFLGIIIMSCMGPFTSMGAKDAAQIALRRLGMNVIMALFVIAFAAVPTVNLSPKVLHYSPLCVPGGKQVTPGHTGTTYDNAFPIPTNVKVPILWYLVMAFSNGVTHAANAGLTCSNLNYRNLHETLNTAVIHSPELKKEAIQFYNDCYVPSYSRFLNANFDQTTQSEIDNAVAKYGKTDVNWIGSEIFQTVPGFYDSFRSQTIVPGFPFDPERDIVEAQLPSHSQWGKPSCLQWWNDSNHGLHARLMKAVPVSVMSAIMHFGYHTQDMQNDAIKSLIHQSFNGSYQDNLRGYESLDDNVSGSIVSRYIGAPIGITFESLKYYPKLHLLINALPIIQGSLLFALYAFLALALPFASYRPGFCITMTMILFSLTFCSYIWHLVMWFDNHMIVAMYGGPMDALVDSTQSPVYKKFADMIMGTLYIVLPLLWMTMMSWASFKIGGFFGGLIGNLTSPGESAGNAAGSAAASGIKSGISGALKGG